MGYGFQAFEFELARGPAGRTRLDFKDPLGDGTTAGARLEQTVALLAGSGVLLGLPNPRLAGTWQQPADTENNKGQPALAVQSYESTDEGWLLITFRYGLVGEFEFAIDRDGQRNMVHSAASSRYRALVCWPAAGEMGRLAVESIGTRCPAPALVRWLGRIEYEQDSDSCINYLAHQIADRDHIKQLATTADKVGVRLRNTVSERRSKLEVQADTLEMKQNVIAAAHDLATGKPNSVQRIEEIAGFDAQGLQTAGLTFDRGDLLIDDRVLDAERIRAKFNYPLSKDIPLENSQWASDVVTQLKSRLSAHTDIFVT